MADHTITLLGRNTVPENTPLAISAAAEDSLTFKRGDCGLSTSVVLSSTAAWELRSRSGGPGFAVAAGAALRLDLNLANDTELFVYSAAGGTMSVLQVA